MSVKSIRILCLMLLGLLCNPVLAFEDCLISSSSKLSDIKVYDSEIVNVYPIYTLLNEKNTLYVQPLKLGETKFTILMDGKETHMFSVKVEPEKTLIENTSGFEVVTIDLPPGLYEYELDEPPTQLKK